MGSCSDTVQLNHYSQILRRQCSLVEAPLQMFPWKRKPCCQNEIGHEHHSVSFKIYYLKSASQYSRNLVTKTWCLICISMHYGLWRPLNKRVQKVWKTKALFLIQKYSQFKFDALFEQLISHIYHRKNEWLRCRKFDQNYYKCRKTLKTA